MAIVLNSLIFLVAVMHFAFMIIEMFFWTKPLGLKVFRQSIEQAQVSKVLAANQGLYNGFLASGLIWSLVHPVNEMALQLRFFFLLCVVIAGVFGAMTVSRKILFIQAGPAIVALALMSFFCAVESSTVPL